MKMIISGPNGNLAYWNAARVRGKNRAFGFQGQFRQKHACAFARLPAFSDNSNHGPTGQDGAIVSEMALEWLFNIAGAR